MPNPTTAPADGERLQLRMQRIRNRMHARVDGLRLDAESLFDWRYYVRRFPLSSLLSAAVVGFWLTPGRLVARTVKLDDGTIDNLIDRGAFRMEPSPAASGAAWWGPLRSIVGTILTRAALAHVERVLSRQHHPVVAPQEESVR
ncbi:MAG TPA: hypothetical protein VL132_23125 [Planctomycetaceae bacterium]|nr:hypothetical protein [Planctomycetaceae bacterium]